MFEKEFASNNEAKKEDLRPIIVPFSVKKSMEMTIKYLKDNGYEGTKVSNDYFEIFTSKNNFEYTFMFINNENASTIIRVLAYTEKTFGGAKKEVKKINLLLKELFN